MAGLIGVPERTAYAASKHAVTGFFAPHRARGSGVSVTLIHRFVVSKSIAARSGPTVGPAIIQWRSADHDRGALRWLMVGEERRDRA
jgi:short-subunit dehydrogenase